MDSIQYFQDSTRYSKNEKLKPLLRLSGILRVNTKPQLWSCYCIPSNRYEYQEPGNPDLCLISETCFHFKLHHPAIWEWWMLLESHITSHGICLFMLPKRRKNLNNTKKKAIPQVDRLTPYSHIAQYHRCAVKYIHTNWHVKRVLFHSEKNKYWHSRTRAVIGWSRLEYSVRVIILTAISTQALKVCLIKAQKL